MCNWNSLWMRFCFRKRSTSPIIVKGGIKKYITIVIVNMTTILIGCKLKTVRYYDFVTNYIWQMSYEPIFWADAFHVIIFVKISLNVGISSVVKMVFHFSCLQYQLSSFLSLYFCMSAIKSILLQFTCKFFPFFLHLCRYHDCCGGKKAVHN